MKIDLPARRPRRRINLTPLIDVVLMLLVFFMMVSRFGGTQGLALQAGQGSGVWQGPPRLVSVTRDGPRLNGVPTAPDALAVAVAPLMAAPTDPVILKTETGAPVQALVDVMDALRGAGITSLVVMGAE